MHFMFKGLKHLSKALGQVFKGSKHKFKGFEYKFSCGEKYFWLKCKWLIVGV